MGGSRAEIERGKDEARPKRRRHACGSQQRVGQGQVSAQAGRGGACELLAAAVLHQTGAPAHTLLAANCRQHGALGFNGIARTEAEELANRVATLEAQVRGLAVPAAAADAATAIMLLLHPRCMRAGIEYPQRWHSCNVM